MGRAQTVTVISQAEYLQMERLAEQKSEYFDGEIFAMAGGSPRHSQIAANLISEFHQRLKGRGCVVFDSNLRIKVEATGLYTYPDLTVACGQHRFVDDAQDTLVNPTVLVEVLSDSTEAYDRGKKFENYRQIPSLREYLLVSQHEARVEQYLRQPDGHWLLREAAGLAAVLEMPALQITLPLGEIFAEVQFQPGPLRARTANRTLI